VISKKRALLPTLALALSLDASFCGEVAQAQAPKPEKENITLAIGGVSTQIYFLPVVLADRLGYFEQAGMKVNMINTGSGTKALQAVVSGGADMTAGSFEHVIQLQGRGQDIRAIVKFGLYYGNVLGIVSHRTKDYKSPADMKGWKIGVSATGASSQFFVALLLAKYGVKPDEVSFIGVGQGPGGVAAVRTGKSLDAIAVTDPTITELESSKDIVVAADSRSLKGTIEVYGGETISGVLYTRQDFIKQNPNTVQAAATAIIRALEWIKKASIDEVMAKVPQEFWARRPELYKVMLEKNITSFENDGRISRKATEVILDFLRKIDPALRDVKLDLAKTYEGSFVENARAELGLK
jgi:NitT/TauT family transport system substrate-binding protein